MIYFLIVLFVIGVGFCFWRQYVNRNEYMDSGGWAITGIVILALSLSVIVPAITVPISSGVAVKEHKIFYDVNVNNYKATADDATTYLSEEEYRDNLIGGSIEYAGQAGYISERLAEWRDAVNEYNEWLARYEYYDSHWFIGVLYSNLPEELTYLEIR